MYRSSSVRSDGPLALQDAPTQVDGRTARSRRTRRAVVEALLALLEEGDLSPTAQRVAERAGVALRTVYGHFSDMETLYAEAGELEFTKLLAYAEDVDPAQPIGPRVEQFCRQRARVIEALLPVMRASRLREPFSPAMRANRQRFIDAGVEQNAYVFGPELRRLDPQQRAVLADGIYIASCVDTWDVLRADRGLSPAEALAVMTRTVRDLVDPGGTA